MAKRDPTPRADDWHDPNPRDEQRRHYRLVLAQPTWRNRGPKGRMHPGWRRSFHVVRDLVLPNGRTTVAALAGPFHSRGSCRRALAHVVGVCTDARVVRSAHDPAFPLFAPLLARQQENDHA